MTSYPGIFVVFEGPDGSGHTTQAERFAEHVRSRGRVVYLTREPTSQSPVADTIRKSLKKEIVTEPVTLQELFVADRAWHIEHEIMPALLRGEVVVCDRYFFSTIAYGSAASSVDHMAKLNAAFPVPDLTFIIDVSPETSMLRIQKRGNAEELFEKAEFLAKGRAIYQSFPKLYPNTHLIDGEVGIDEVFSHVIALSTGKI